MVREDVIAGIKNAIERGYSLEMARQSFINAGYPREEVEAAISAIQSGYVITEENVSTTPMQTYESPEAQPIARQPSPSMQPTTQPTTQPIYQETLVAKPKSSFVSNLEGNWKIILLISLLAILVVVFILTIIFREEIVNWLTP